MNQQMWWNAATERSVAQLAADGIAILVPTRANARTAQMADAVNYSQHPKPFKWTATADSILAKLERVCKVVNGTQHATLVRNTPSRRKYERTPLA